MDDREQLVTTIAALEAQRSILGDMVLNTALLPLREKLVQLTTPTEAKSQRKQVTVLMIA